MMVDCRGRFLQPTRLHSIKGKSPEKCNSKRLQDRSRQHLKEARRKQQATTTTFRDTLEGHLARKIFLPPSVSQTTWMVGWSVGTLKSTMFFFRFEMFGGLGPLDGCFSFPPGLWKTVFARCFSFSRVGFQNFFLLSQLLFWLEICQCRMLEKFFFPTFSPFSFRP